MCFAVLGPNLPDASISFPVTVQKFPARRRREFGSDRRAILDLSAARDGPSQPKIAKFPVFSRGSGNWAGYNAWQVEAAVAKVPVLRMEIVKRSDDMKGFIVLPRRWVVERTFSWFGRNRRLAKDFENLAETLATFVTLACIQLAVRRLARL